MSILWTLHPQSFTRRDGDTANAGKHIYCEKPLALTAAEAAEIVAAVEAAGVTTIVGFNYFKNPAQAYASAIKMGAGRHHPVSEAPLTKIF